MWIRFLIFVSVAISAFFGWIMIESEGVDPAIAETWLMSLVILWGGGLGLKWVFFGGK